MNFEALPRESASYFDREIRTQSSTILNVERYPEDQIRALAGQDFFIRHAFAQKRLREYHENLQASPATLKNIEKLKDPQCLVVVTGQQCGFLTGPLLTIYKALTVTLLAERLEKRWGIPLVPVFWNPSEDHDFEEVNHLYFPDTLEKHRLDRPFSRMPLESVFVDHSTLNWFETFWKGLASSEFTTDLKRWSLPLLGEPLSHWYSRLLLKLFSGLVLFEPYLFREEAFSLFQETARLHEPLLQTFQEQIRQIKAQGFQTQLSPDPHVPLFFLLQEGQRVKGSYYPQEKTFQFAQETYSLEALEKGLKEGRLKGSTTVSLRPILQGKIFPVLTYVAGPSEGNYLLEILPLFPLLKQKAPLLFPRLSVTLIEPKIKAKLEKINRSFVEIQQECLPFSVLQEQQELDQAYEKCYQNCFLSFQEFSAFVSSKDKNFSQDQTWSSIQQRLEQFKKKIEKRWREQEGISQQQTEQVKRALWPRGSFQERTLNLFPFLNKYGEGWFSEFKQKLPFEPLCHQLVSW
jgi:bacillithiol biosynthesis cysteine-adding enzyme BshC